MPNFDEFERKTNDWKITSYGDIGLVILVGVKITHLKFFSPKLNQYFNTVFVETGAGYSLKIGFDLATGIDNFLKSITRAVEASQANSNYKPLYCHRAFSAWDISWARAGGIETEIASICGMKVGGLSATNGGPLFEVPYDVSPSFGLGGGATAKVGIIVPFDNQITELYRREQFEIEMQVRKNPWDPFPRQPGGFGM